MCRRNPEKRRWNGINSHRQVTIDDVRYVPAIKFNPLSTTLLLEVGCKIIFERQVCKVYQKGSRVISANRVGLQRSSFDAIECELESLTKNSTWKIKGVDFDET